MLDEIKSKKEALILIKQGGEGIKQDKSKATQIYEGITRLQSLSDNDSFVELVCAIGYEKMSQFKSAISHYDICIESIPDSSLKYGILGMKCRALAKWEEEKRQYYVLQSAEWYKKAFEIETIPKWKEWWADSLVEVQRLK